MEALTLLRRALSAAGEVLRIGQDIQSSARMDLIKDLHAICLKCETAYETVLLRLVPVKNALQDPDRLATELRSLASDVDTRDAFKPEYLSGEADVLLSRLENNLDPMKYALEVNRLKEIREHVEKLGYFDPLLNTSYDQFMRALDSIATQIQTPGVDKAERAEYVRKAIYEFEEELRAAIDDIRGVKDAILRGT